MTAAEAQPTGTTDTTRPKLSVMEVIRSEFREMPGLRLSRAQFRRLWSLTPDDCDRIVANLIEAGFLVECRKGLIRRKAASC